MITWDDILPQDWDGYEYTIVLGITKMGQEEGGIRGTIVPDAMMNNTEACTFPTEHAHLFVKYRRPCIRLTSENTL